MITEMFIEGNRVDLTADISALITYQLDDIKNIGSRNTNFSKTIVMPGTAQNNRVFGNTFEVQTALPYDEALPNVLANFNAAKGAACVIFQGNIQVFKGIIRLLEIIVDGGVIEYEVAVFGVLGGLVSELGNRKLEDINWEPFISNYELDYTLANIEGSWSAIGGGDGFYYPLIDYGGYSVSKQNWDYRTFRPALYVKDYIDKILHYTSYEISCPLFETARFKRLIVPHNQKQLTKLNTTLASIASTGTQLITTNGQKLVLPTVSGSFTPNGSNNEFTYAGPTIGFKINMNVQGYFDGVTYSIRFTKVPASGPTVFDTLFDGGGTGSGSFNMDYSDYFSSTIANGDKIYVSVLRTSVGAGTPSLEILSASITLELDAAIQVPIALGDTININDVIPRGVLQKDFISSILKLFNLYVHEDPNNDRLLKITPYIEFYDTDPDSFVDWTYKLDRSRPIRIKPMSELNSRYYEFKFKKDSDYWNDLYEKRYAETYGSRVYDSEFEFAGEKSSVDLIFAGTPLVGYSGEDKVFSTIFKKSGTTEENIDSVIRILQAKKITGVNSWSILDDDGVTVLDSYTEYGYAGHLDDPDAPADDINFGVPKELFFTLVSGGLNVNQFNAYWSPYLAEITDKDSRLVTATFRLSPRDIYELDFSKFVFVDGSIFRLVKIEDYNASKEDTCKVSLLKVINTLY